MRILVLGLGKTGTTALLYKIANGLPDCSAFSGGMPGKYLSDYKNAVFKHTYNEQKGKNIELYEKHFNSTSYDRKVWISRDPRDASISRMLYRWHKGHWGYQKQYASHLAMVKKKESNPLSVPFYTICQYSGKGEWPRGLEEVLEEERSLYRRLPDFINSLSSDWIFFKYEDMVMGNYDALNQKLGFEVGKNTEVPESTGKAKVIRKKAMGDWKDWYTPEDVIFFTPIFSAYMDLVGYDTKNWQLNPTPSIDPEYSSKYMERLVKRRPVDLLRSLWNQMRWYASRWVNPQSKPS